VQWVRRIERHPLPGGSAPEGRGTGPAERHAPGLTAFFRAISEDRSHAVLDLGAGASSSLRVYSRFARWVRFADVLTAATSPSRWPEVLASLPPHSERPFDLVIAWDVLDRLPAEHRPDLVNRLAEITAPDARLFLLSAAPDVPIGPLRFTLVDLDRMQYERTGEARPAHLPPMPAELQRVLSPFELLGGFSTQLGLREYVAERTRNWPRRAIRVARSKSV
jgi:hypothetical protein